MQDPELKPPLIYLGGIPRGGQRVPAEVWADLKGQIVLSRPREKVTMRGGTIRSRQLLQDPEPKEPVPHPDDGLPDPTNGRPCPTGTRGGCPEEPPRPVPDPSPPRPGEGPVVV